MPVVRTIGAGSTDTASGETTLRRTVPVAAAGSAVAGQLSVLGLPHLGYWLRQTTPGAVCNVTPQFAIREMAGLVTPALEWLDFSAPVALPFNVPIFIPFRFPALFIRVSLANPGQGIAASVEVALGACL